MFCSPSDRIQTASELQIDWLDSPLNFDEVSWNSGFYFREGYLQALIDGSGNRGRFLFSRICQKGELIAIGCFQELVLYRDELDELGRLFSSDSKLAIKAESFVKSLVNLGRGKKGIRILIAGNCQVTGPYGFCFSPKLDDIEKSECISALLRSAEITHGPFSITLVKDFLPEHESIIETIRAEGFRRIPTLPVMRFYLEKKWKSYDDYLQAMASKYRIRAKAARKKGIELERQNWDIEQIQNHLAEIEELYRNVFEKARFRLFRVEPTYFLSLKSSFKEKFIFKAYKVDGKLVGFSTFLIDDKQSDAHLIGLDYSANKQYSLYQNMLYDYVESGIDAQTQCIDFGRTAMEIKSTIGAIPESSPVVVKMRNHLLNGIACMLVENSAPSPWIQRHPFREED